MRFSIMSFPRTGPGAGMRLLGMVGTLVLLAGACGEATTPSTGEPAVGPASVPTTLVAPAAVTTTMVEAAPPTEASAITAPPFTTTVAPTATTGSGGVGFPEWAATFLVFERTDFALADSGLMRVDPDGGDLGELAAETNAFYETPVWSPAGSRVAVSKWGPATGDLGPMPGQDIWLMDPNGDNLTNLTNSPESSEYDPQWSPDGSKIAFWLSPQQSNSNGSLDIWTISVDGTDQVPLTMTPDRNERAPVWSPDGSQLAFASGPLEGGPPGSDRIEVIDADGTERTVLADLSATDLQWSPDGSRLAFCQMMGWVESEYGEADQVPTYDIWVIDGDGNNLINLTKTPELNECGPRWAPHGSRIAYSSQGDIWSMDSSGNNKTNLTGTDYPNESGHEWSPDGSRIAYSRDDDPRRPSSDWGQTAIWVMNANGSDQAKLTSGDFWDHNLAWQPLRSAPK